MIELAGYNCLSLKEKVEFLQSNAVYLCSRQEPEFIIDLYQLDNFYVEGFYHKRRRALVQIHCFSSTDQLSTYFSDIDIKTLIEELAPL